MRNINSSVYFYRNNIRLYRWYITGQTVRRSFSRSSNFTSPRKRVRSNSRHVTCALSSTKAKEPKKENKTKEKEKETRRKGKEKKEDKKKEREGKRAARSKRYP